MSLIDQVRRREASLSLSPSPPPLSSPPPFLPPPVFSYNAMKYHLQDGNIDHPLPAVNHLLCAVVAGKPILSLSSITTPPPPSPPGALTLSVTNPVWVVKTRMCLVSTSTVPHYMQYGGLWEGLVNLWKYEGIRGLYSVRVSSLSQPQRGFQKFKFE